MAAPNWLEIRYTSRDGLRLYARHYPAPPSKRRPVLCLPGLTRNSRDFHVLATSLSQGADARDVYALDYRGRGQSEYASDPTSYTVFTELNDVLDFMTLAGLHDAGVIGTSRGGILAMLMGAARPTAIGAVVLNDIGPTIEANGVARIAAYVGRIPLPLSWQEAADIVKRMNVSMFPALSDAQWDALARQLFDEKDGRPAQAYDSKLAQMFSAATPIPSLWPQFMSLKHVSMLAIRGANSDLLSETTLTEMQRRHPDIVTLTVANEGHAPLLMDIPTIAEIAAFLGRSDAIRKGPRS